MMGLLSFLTGSAFRELTSNLSKAYESKQKALTDKERIDAEKQIAFFEQQISLARSAAENDRWYSPRSIMGVTPNPGNQVTSIVLTVVGFYFGSKALGDVAGKLASAFVRR